MNYCSLRRSNVLVMQPDPILSAGLVAALRQHAAFEVYVHGVDNLGPEGARIDVVIADYGNAMQLTQPAQRVAYGLMDEARMLAFTRNDREADIRRAIEAGVHGYLLVGGPLNDLIDGVTAVASGLRYMSQAVAQRIADSLTRATLTSREIEVLKLAAAGRPNKTIGRMLGIEVGTVKSHMSATMAKLGASSRTDAARIAAARGLLENDAANEAEARFSNSPMREPASQCA
ncbi:MULTISPECIES: response regulator transcription factor [unclassified Variovorax]|uniref:response regulator transcription factor n=1 Tax=unclassified Variovorax TaxID=663243 RepID=UPI00076BC8E1|nr:MULTISPECIES: response regulator transcription factor [unclassified Variovorax]KWT64518.1 two component transcriptional regulator, LuxR family [Variovorax sp. WDL1]PNG56390.1 Transcriptional regulatory protein DegU [Variovorax sp. B4]PNG57814.1 Transcriptional regulatory protein DegU [Variovorax sp. B2]VTV09745.1 Protease production enhancer protein [Variovorax sp. WDL1]